MANNNLYCVPNEDLFVWSALELHGLVACTYSCCFYTYRITRQIYKNGFWMEWKQYIKIYTALWEHNNKNSLFQLFSSSTNISSFLPSNEPTIMPIQTVTLKPIFWRLDFGDSSSKVTSKNSKKLKHRSLTFFPSLNSFFC